MEKYIEQYLNIVSDENPSHKDIQKAKECYILGIKILLEEMDSHFLGWLTKDREEFWKNQINKYGNN
jgi:hypothetical protein